MLSHTNSSSNLAHSWAGASQFDSLPISLHAFSLEGSESTLWSNIFFHFIYLHVCLVTSVVSDSLRPHGPWAHQAPLPMRFSRQEYRSGLPFPSPVIKYEVSEVSKVKSLSHVRLCDPMDCSLPGSSVHGISQARVLEWSAVFFSFAIVCSQLDSHLSRWLLLLQKFH